MEVVIKSEEVGVSEVLLDFDFAEELNLEVVWCEPCRYAPFLVVGRLTDCGLWGDWIDTW